MERDREAVRFVADALDEEERGIVFGQNDRFLPVAGEEHLLFLGDTDRHQIAQPDRLERLVRGGE